MNKLPSDATFNAALAHAMTWLEAHHGAAAASAIDAMLYGDVSESERQALENLDAATARRLRCNAAEWLLAEGRLRIGGAVLTASACVLGPDGPSLDASERAWIERLALTPLRLYEVVAAAPDGATILRDVLAAADAAPVVVNGPAPDELPPPGSRVGLRVLDLDGRHALSGAVYAFSRAAAASVAIQLRESAELFGDNRADLPQLLSMLIRHCWVAHCSEPATRTGKTLAIQPGPSAGDACGVRDKSICPGVRAHARKGDKAVGDMIEQALTSALTPKN